MPTLLMLRALPWKLIGLSALALAFLGMFAALKIEQAQNGKLKAQIEKCSDARKADLRSYQSAQSEAAAKNRAEVARIESEQERVTHEVESNLTARLERLRNELRANTAAQGASGGSKAGANGKAPGGAAEAARLCLAPDDVLRAAENEERHDQLINWVEEQLKINR